MAALHGDEFAVRIALTNGLTQRQVASDFGVDHTPPRSSTTKLETIRPSSLPGINAVPGNGSNIAQKPDSG